MFAAITVKIGLGGLLLLPFWIAAIGWLSSRILGIHLGRWRAGIAAFLGWIVGLTAAALVVGGDTTVPDWIIIVLVIFFGVLAALPFAIVLDLITRSTGPPRRGRRRPIKAIHAAIAPLGRFREVVHNARKENLVSPRYRSAAALNTPAKPPGIFPTGTFLSIRRRRLVLIGRKILSMLTGRSITSWFTRLARKAGSAQRS